MFFMLTRQFPSAGSGQLCRFFQPRLPALDRSYRQGITMLQTENSGQTEHFPTSSKGELAVPS